MLPFLQSELDSKLSRVSSASEGWLSKTQPTSLCALDLYFMVKEEVDLRSLPSTVIL